MSHIPDAVMDRIRDTTSEQPVTSLQLEDVVRLIYENPPSPTTFSTFDDRKRSTPLIPGAWYECSDGVVRRAIDYRDYDDGHGNTSFGVDATEIGGLFSIGGFPFLKSGEPLTQKSPFTILRRVTVATTAPPPPPDPINAVLKALDNARGAGVAQEVFLHPKQIEGLKVLLKEIWDHRSHPLWGTPATAEAVRLFRSAVSHD